MTDIKAISSNKQTTDSSSSYKVVDDHQSVNQLSNDKVITSDDDTTTSDSDIPEDTNNITWILNLTFGIAVLFPSSALLSSSDYFEEAWGERGKKLLFLIPLFIAISSPIVQMLVAAFQERLSYTRRITVCFTLNSIVVVLFPVIVQLFPANASYYLALLIALVVGIDNSILKATTISLAALFPPKYSHALVIGKGISPLIVVILKMIVKYLAERNADESSHKAAVQFGAYVFFSLSAIATVVAACMYHFARRTPFAKHYLPSAHIRRQLREDQHQALLDAANNGSVEGSDGDDENISAYARPDKILIFKKVSGPLFYTFTNFAIAYAIFPGLLGKMEPTWNMSKAWFTLVHLAVFSFFDCVVRLVPYHITEPYLNRNTMGVFVILRILFYPMHLYPVYIQTISSEITIIINTLSAATCGFAAVAIFRNFQSYCKPNERNIAGTYMSTSIVSGVLFGTLLSYIVEEIYERL